MFLPARWACQGSARALFRLVQPKAGSCTFLFSPWLWQYKVRAAYPTRDCTHFCFGICDTW